MPRLDVWLVETGRFRSRQTAKRAIRDGLITVNGRLAKPSTQLNGTESIIISGASDLLMGYDKLSHLDSLLGGNVVKSGDMVLDLGSSAGGFLEYILEKGAIAKGIEISERFKDGLLQLASTHPNVSIVIGDAFKIEPLTLFNESELDLLLVDVTTDPEGTAALIAKYSELLKHGGRLIAAFKSRLTPSIATVLTDRVSALGYTDVSAITLDDSRQEFHVAGVRL
ncbi:MAG: cell division protein FtsJ [Candidatus Thorarchaeota archaeon]|nr:MAG: cell division protein FtsJ [Candidatus Thorarchaeota archaeon]